VCAHVRVRKCVCACVRVCFSLFAVPPHVVANRCVQKGALILQYMYVCMCVCVSACVHIYAYVHIYIYTYVHIYIYTYVRIHTHTHTQGAPFYLPLEDVARMLNAFAHTKRLETSRLEKSRVLFEDFFTVIRVSL